MTVKREADSDSALDNADEDEREIAEGDDARAKKEPEGVETYAEARQRCAQLRNNFFVNECWSIACGFVYDREHYSLKRITHHTCRKLQHCALNYEVFKGNVCASIHVYANEKVRKYERNTRREELLRH